MKKILNEILLKLAENELNNSVIDEQAGEAWNRIKAKFNRDKYDYTAPTMPNTSDAVFDTDETEGVDVVNMYARSYHIDPPMINATINSPFGKWRPKSGRRHKGIDMKTNVGTTVYTVRPGKVVYIGDDPRGFGDYVIIKHEGKEASDAYHGSETFYSLYAHLSNIQVSNNEDVDWSTVVGKSGGAFGAPGAGNSEGPHLHFEIRTSASGGSIDPVKFYAKYRQKLENANLYQRSINTNSNTSADYIVTPGDGTKTISNIETPIGSRRDNIVPGETEWEGFHIYELPKDKTYLYGVPIPSRTDFTYGWWFMNSNDTDPEWKYLKSRLSAADYNIAISRLNSAYPDAIDQDKLAATEIPPRDNTTIKKNKKNKKNNEPVPEPVPVKRDSNKKIFSLLVPGVAYASTSILKSKPKYKLYKFDATTKKLVSVGDGEITSTDSIIYIGHDTSNQYMHMQVVEPGINPGTTNKYWISVNDIELKK